MTSSLDLAGGCCSGKDKGIKFIDSKHLATDEKLWKAQHCASSLQLGKMESSNGSRRPKRMSTLEKMLIFLFLAMTGVTIAFIVLYFVNQPTSEPTHVPGECVLCENALIFRIM